MAARAGFKESQHKCLFESIMVKPTSSERPYPEPICSEPVLTLAQVPAPSTTTVGIIPELDKRLPSIEGISHHESRSLSSSPDHLSNESIECVACFPSHPNSSHIPSRDKITELIRQIPSFIERETCVKNIRFSFQLPSRSQLRWRAILINLSWPDSHSALRTPPSLTSCPCRTTRISRLWKW